MKAGNYYFKNLETGKKVGSYFALFLCLLLIGSPVIARPVVIDNPPVFVNGNLQTFAVCENAPATSIDSLMSINDADPGQPETWTILSGAFHGTLGGFITTALSTGGTVTPTGLTYTPSAGYSGNDTFVVEVFDGTDTGTTTVIVTVNPTPTLTSSLTPPSICDGGVFSYVPISSVPGATLAWRRLYVGGIANPTDTGSGNPFEKLVSVTYYNIPVDYQYTITANGCVNMEDVVVIVKPTPRLSSSLTSNICSGGTFRYLPTSTTTGTTFTWARANVVGISPAISSGTDSVHESLMNVTSAPLTTVYAFSLDAYGCTSTSNVVLTVNPPTPITTITTAPSPSLCSNTQVQSFGAGIMPPAGVSYTWSAVNALVNAVGNDQQFALVSFPNPGNASVILTIKVSGTGCVSNDTFDVMVGTSVSSSSSVIYNNSQFIYLNNNIDSYQWGYDDAGTLQSNTIAGETFQSYPNSAPDFVNNLYWVMTTRNGCMQKTYYNGPLAVTNIPTGTITALKIFPNPSDNVISVDVNVVGGSNCKIVMTDMLGKIVKTQQAAGRTTQMNVADLPSGCYFVCCYEGSVKTAVTRFIKN